MKERGIITQAFLSVKLNFLLEELCSMANNMETVQNDTMWYYFLICCQMKPSFIFGQNFRIFQHPRFLVGFMSFVRWFENIQMSISSMGLNPLSIIMSEICT
jgi:hypothetical protein